MKFYDDSLQRNKLFLKIYDMNLMVELLTTDNFGDVNINVRDHMK